MANKADANLPGFSGERALHAAAKNGDAELIHELIKHGADVSARDDHGDSPLHFAAQANAIPAAKILLTSKADVNARDKEGNTPLHDAARAGNTEFVSLLLDSGASVNAANNVNITPLSFAVANGRTDAVRVLLEHKADPNHSGPADFGQNSYSADSRPVIYQAIRSDEILKLLLDAGANPEGDSTSPESPLFAAILNNKIDAVQLLLQHGANPNGSARTGESPLNEVFSYNKDTRIVPLLLDKGADPNARHDGLVPLMRTQDPEVLRELIQHKADVNARVAEGYTPLMSSGNSPEKFKILLENGANPNLQDTNGNTALHHAVFNSDTNSVAILLANKADPNIQNNQGYTPLDLADAGRSFQFGSLMGPNYGQKFLSSEAQNEISELLTKAGGLANLPKRNRIDVRRGSSTDISIFSKGQHDWNHFSLLELISAEYGLLSTSESGEWKVITGQDSSIWGSTLKFPDFRKITIYRRTGDNTKQTETEVNVEDILAAGDCSHDVWLKWGDVIEIPEADHPVDEQWKGPAESVISALTNCVARQVTIKIKGESTTLKLAPEFGPMSKFRNIFGMLELTQASFMLRSVLDQSKLIRVSSDLSHVKVIRHDPVTKKTVEWIVDCNSPDQADLWLRDGDVVEVPEK